MILMLWFYVTGLAFLIGGQVNSTIEHAAAEHGHPEAKAHRREKPLQHEIVASEELAMRMIAVQGKHRVDCVREEELLAPGSRPAETKCGHPPLRGGRVYGVGREICVRLRPYDEYEKRFSS